MITLTSASASASFEPPVKSFCPIIISSDSPTAISTSLSSELMVAAEWADQKMDELEKKCFEDAERYYLKTDELDLLMNNYLASKRFQKKTKKNARESRKLRKKIFE